MPGYRIAKSAVRIPVPGKKVIEELFGKASTAAGDFSLAHMVAPPGWGEPPQTPEFGELTVMVRGTMQVEVAGEVVQVRAGQAIWTEPGATVRYSNPSAEECEYFAVCIPAFEVGRAHRE